MKPKGGEKLRDLIIKNEYRSVLELGFKRGISTCYLAEGLDRNGGGNIATMDLPCTAAMTPTLHDTLRKVGISQNVTVDVYCKYSYTWHLMRFLGNKANRFDFCFVDGSHIWETDGFAFFLVDKMLDSGGCIVFDDLDWILAFSSCWKSKYPIEFKFTKQVRKIWELLVKPHPNYHKFTEYEGMGIAFKK